MRHSPATASRPATGTAATAADPAREPGSASRSAGAGASYTVHPDGRITDARGRRVRRIRLPLTQADLRAMAREFVEKWMREHPEQEVA